MLAIVALTLAVIAQPAANADVPGLRIGTIGYNAVGNDRPWNRNAEYIDISNVSGSPKNVKDLLVRDQWSKSQGDGYAGTCNTFKVAALPDIAPTGTGEILLPNLHTIRVYVGQGTPRTFAGGTIHAVYMNHGVGASAGCGYNGHFLNNTRDVVWIKLGTDEESKVYDFRRGYYVR
jgi:hypothetical protein